MRRLALHTGLYVLLLAAVAVVIPLDASFGSDDGAYGGAVHARRAGSWTLQRPLPVVPQGNEGWLNSAITPDGPTPYTAKPSYAVALTTVVRLVHGPARPGETAGELALGLHLLPLSGAVLSALAAWSVAKRWDPSAAPLAFWLVGLGPVLVNATTLWAHTLSTASAGLALACLIRIPADRRLGTVALACGAVAAIAIGSAVRTESLFWTIGLCFTFAVLNRSVATAATAVTGLVFGSGVWYLDRAWGVALRADRLPIQTSVEALAGDQGWVATRFPAAWRLLLTSLGGGPGAALALLAVTAAIVAAVRLRFHQERVGEARVLLGASAALYAAHLVVAPTAVIDGMVAAWPAMVVLLVAGHHRRAWLGPLLGPAAVLVLAVLATQYASSGGLQWGGRYLSMAYVPLAAAAALGGQELLRRHPVPLGALLVVPAALGLSASNHLHQRHHDATASAAAGDAEVVLSEVPAFPRIAWPALPTAFYLASPANVEPLLAELASAGVRRVNVQGLDDIELDGVAGYRLIDERSGMRWLHLDAPPPTLAAAQETEG